MQAIQLKFNDKIIRIEKVNLLKSFFGFGRLLLSALLFLMPLMFLTSATVYNEELAFGIYATAVLLTVGIFLGLLLYKGRSLLIDPKGFLNVLIYALLVITPSVITSPGTSANTFGLVGVRSVSGLATILFVMAFYFINLFNVGSRIKKNLPVIALVSNIAILLGILTNFGTLINTPTVGALPVLSFLLAVSVVNFVLGLKVTDFRFRVVNTLVLAVIAFFILGGVSSEFKLILSFVLGLFFYLLILRAVKRVGAKNFKNEFITNARLQFYVVAAVVSLLAVILTLLAGPVEFTAIKSILNYYSYFGDMDGQDFAQIIAGQGVVLVLVKASSTLFAIISSFGLVGLMGYLSIFFYLFRREAKLVNKGGEIGFNSVLNILVLILIAVSSVFVQIGIYSSLVFLFILTESDKFETFLLKGEVKLFSNSALRALRKVLVFVVVVFMAIVSFNLLKLLGIVV